MTWTDKHDNMNVGRILAVKINVHDICMILFLYQPQLNELSYKDWHILKTLPEAGGKVACVSWNVHTQRDNDKSR